MRVRANRVQHPVKDPRAVTMAIRVVVAMITRKAMTFRMAMTFHLAMVVIFAAVGVPASTIMVVAASVVVAVALACRFVHGIHNARRNTSPHINNYQVRACAR
jgi:hypothetical protein